MDIVSSDDLDLCSGDGGIQQLQVLIKELKYVIQQMLITF